MQSTIESIESLEPDRVRPEIRPRPPSTQFLPAVVVGIVVALILTAVLVSAPTWLPVLFLYVTRLRSRKADQRAQLARNLGINTLDRNKKRLLGSSTHFGEHRKPCLGMDLIPSQPPISQSPFTFEVTQVAIKSGFYGQLLPTSNARDQIS